ncbi:MAG: RNA polymerase sigma factor [Bacteroidia bacterium]
MTTIEFNEQLIKQRPALKNFALSLTADPDDAQDLLQDTFLKAITYRDKFADATNLKAWLYMIMKNTFINSYRRAVKTREIMQNSKDAAMASFTGSIRKNASESRINEKETLRHIELLEDEYRIPFTRFYAGYKYKDIADEMNLPIGTVKSRIFLARKKLMEQLRDFRN